MYNTNGNGKAKQSWHVKWTDISMTHYGNGLNGIQVPPPNPPNSPTWKPYPAPTKRPASPGVRSFYNPITLRISVPDKKYDKIAIQLYQNGSMNSVKGNYANLKLNLTADLEIRTVLAGLSYVNESNRPDKTLLRNWIAALKGLNRFRQNEQAIRHTIHTMENKL